MCQNKFTGTNFKIWKDKATHSGYEESVERLQCSTVTTSAYENGELMNMGNPEY
jgi:hypothetical protein